MNKNTFYAISEKSMRITNHQNRNQNERQKTQERILSYVEIKCKRNSNPH